MFVWMLSIILNKLVFHCKREINLAQIIIKWYSGEYVLFPLFLLIQGDQNVKMVDTILDGL